MEQVPAEVYIVVHNGLPALLVDGELWRLPTDHNGRAKIKDKSWGAIMAFLRPRK